MLNSVIGPQIDIISFLLCICAALALGILAALIFSIGTKYTGSWKFSIALLPPVVAVVIMLVNGNLGAGLAVGGTFALTRFRSMPGSAKEITGLFFSVTLGLICGMGYICLAFIFFAIFSLAAFILTKMNFGQSGASVRVLKITIPENLDYDEIFDDLFEKYTSSHSLDRVKTTNMGTLYELTYSLTLRHTSGTKAFIDDLRCRNGNLNISLSREREDESI